MGQLSIPQSFAKIGAKKLPCIYQEGKWPPSSPDLNPLDFSIWSNLEANVNKTPHKNLALLKKKLLIEWEKIPLSVIRVSINAFPKRLSQVIDKREGKIK